MFIKDLLFPKFCLGCGYIGSYICSNCQNKLIYLEKDSCCYCRKLSLYGLTHPLCRRQYGIDGVMAIFHYNNLLKTIIKNIKYRLAIDVWSELYRVIKPEMLDKISFYKKLQQNFSLQPIPLYRAKLKERGFNQAEIISQFFSQLLKFPQVDYLIRAKQTQSQAQLKNNKKRYLNIKGAFIIGDKNEINNKHIILVDDVMTTGATVKEATYTLKTNGAKRVFVLTLAKG